MARPRILVPLIEVRVLGGELLVYNLRMPNAPKTPTRTIRVPDDLWKAVQYKAAKEGVTVTSVIIEALEAYIKDFNAK
jgi:hypothetical protein